MAMRWLSEHMDLATEEQKARIELLKRRASDGQIEEGETGVIMLAPILPETDGEEDGSENENQ